jgi:cell division protein FtsI/penicillin-binding protein 2
LQKKAEEVVKKYGDSNEKNYDIKNMALVSQDPKTGQILAMIGSRDF